MLLLMPNARSPASDVSEGTMLSAPSLTNELVGLFEYQTKSSELPPPIDDSCCQ